MRDDTGEEPVPVPVREKAVRFAPRIKIPRNEARDAYLRLLEKDTFKFVERSFVIGFIIILLGANTSVAI